MMNRKAIMKYLFLSGLVLMGTVSSAAQSTKKKGLKKGANISLNIKGKSNDVERTYFNFGLLSNYAYLNGFGLNVISSVTHYNTYGFQLAGITNVTGLQVKGMQIAGIANVTGRSSKGIGIAGIMSVTGHDIGGLYISGLGNMAGRDLSGFTIGGLLNMSGKRSSGLMIGGLANVAGSDQRGFMLAGLMNAAADTLKGVQLTSVLNIAGHSNNGVQLAALANVAVANRGLQTAVLNYAEAQTGAQIGIANFSNSAPKGVQVGIINVSNDSTAHQIGCININPASRAQLLLSGGNLNVFNLALRIKGRHTYTELGSGIYTLGLDRDFSVSAFYRAGIYQPLGSKWTLSGDLGFHHIEACENKNDGYPKRLYALQPRINVEYSFTRKCGVFVSGGYSWTRAYGHSSTFENKATFEAGLVLF